MLVISFMNMKGGTGKTLLCLLLAVTLAQRGKRVAIVDLDPMQLLAQWGKLATCPTNILIFGGVDAEGAVAHITSLSGQFDFVIVDCETRRIDQMKYVARCSSGVMMPVEHIETELAGIRMTIGMLRELGCGGDSGVDFGIVLNRQRPREPSVSSRTRHLDKMTGLVLDTEIEDRVAYRSLLTHGGLLPELGRYGVRHLDKASALASAFATEVVTRVERQRSGHLANVSAEAERQLHYLGGTEARDGLHVAQEIGVAIRTVADRNGWNMQQALERALERLLEDDWQRRPGT